MFEVFQILSNGDAYSIFRNTQIFKVKQFLLEELDPTWKIKIQRDGVFLPGGRNALDCL